MYHALPQGEAPLSVVHLTRDTELGPLKTTDHNKKRLHYRCVSRARGSLSTHHFPRLTAGRALVCSEVARTVPKHERLFKFGCETMVRLRKLLAWSSACYAAEAVSN